MNSKRWDYIKNLKPGPGKFVSLPVVKYNEGKNGIKRKEKEAARTRREVFRRHQEMLNTIGF